MSEFAATWGNYLVEELVPTMAPEVVSAWPQTLGWQIVSAIILFFILRKLYLAWRAYQRDAYRREALAWLDNLPEFTNLQEQNEYRQLPVLLRNTALQAFGRPVVSALSNEHWERWLDQQCDKTSFSNQCATQLQRLAYAPEPKFDSQQLELLLKQVRLWVQYHRRLDD